MQRAFSAVSCSSGFSSCVTVTSQRMPLPLAQWHGGPRDGREGQPLRHGVGSSTILLPRVVDFF